MDTKPAVSKHDWVTLGGKHSIPDGLVIWSSYVTEKYARPTRESHPNLDWDELDARQLELDQILAYESLTHLDGPLGQPFSIPEVELAKHKLKRYGATHGPVPMRLVKDDHSLYGHIADMTLLNQIWSEERLCPSMRISRICPIYKKGDPSDPTNWRPIFVASHDMRLLDGVMTERLNNFREARGLVSDSQCAFRPEHNTTQHTWLGAMAIGRQLVRKEELYTLYVDFAGAFPSVLHVQLLVLLWKHGLTGKCWRVLYDWFAGMQAVLKAGGDTSKPIPIQRGTPEGGKASPGLYTIYLEELLKEVRALQGRVGIYYPHADEELRSQAFADDLRFFITCLSAVRPLMRLLERIAAGIGASFNFGITKTAVMAINVKEITEDVRELFTLNGTHIPFVTRYPYLGIIETPRGLDGLSRGHLIEVAKKARRAFYGWLRTSPTTQDFALSSQLFQTYFLSTVEYGCIVWARNGEFPGLITQLHYAAARVLAGLSPFASTRIPLAPLRALMGWWSLDSRCAFHMLRELATILKRPQGHPLRAVLRTDVELYESILEEARSTGNYRRADLALKVLWWPKARHLLMDVDPDLERMIRAAIASPAIDNVPLCEDLMDTRRYRIQVYDTRKRDAEIDAKSSLSNVRTLAKCCRPLFITLSGAQRVRNWRSLARAGGRGLFGHLPPTCRACPHCNMPNGLDTYHLLRDCLSLKDTRERTLQSIYSNVPAAITSQCMRRGAVPNPRVWCKDTAEWWTAFALGGPFPEVPYSTHDGKSGLATPRLWTEAFPQWQKANPLQRDQLRARSYVLRRAGEYLADVFTYTQACLSTDGNLPDTMRARLRSRL
jgi:hypothetical protein